MTLPVGPTGQDGLSAYAIWLALGNTGGEQIFLDTLIGADCVCPISKYTRGFTTSATHGSSSGLTFDISAADLALQGVTSNPLLCVMTIYFRSRITDPWRLIAPNYGNIGYNETGDVLKDVVVNTSGISLAFNREGHFSVVVIG